MIREEINKIKGGREGRDGKGKGNKVRKQDKREEK